ncbi:BTB domain-containing protein [Mycena kentingensis (nom. inval.)]|nr:BTB domain-containing protein [Mycena kentingensis (nom. inval.)]
MSDATSSSKRKSADQDAPQPLVPLWLPYGDLILDVEATQFRVNRDMLARASPVFADMLAVPQPADGPQLDGVPIVHLSGDSVKDWTLVLDMLYDPFKYVEQVTVEMLAAMLKLGKKYQMDRLSKHAAHYIHIEFPNDRAAYDKLLSEGLSDTTRIQHQSGIELDLLNLVESYELKTSFPTLALLCMKQYTIDQLLHNRIRRDDGARIVLQRRLKTVIGVAAERIHSHQISLLEWLDFDDGATIPCDECLDVDVCSEARPLMQRTLTQGQSGGNFVLLAPWCDIKEAAADLCAECRDTAEIEWNLRRQHSWDRLPKIFGFPSWKNLEDGE